MLNFLKIFLFSSVIQLILLGLSKLNISFYAILGVVLLIYICFTLYIYQYIKQIKPSRLNFSTYIYIFLIAILFVGIQGIGIYITGQYSNDDFLSSTKVFGIFLPYVVLFGPVSEELMFRFYLPSIFKHKLIGITFSSVIFSIIHSPSNIIMFFYYVLFSLALFFVLEKTKSIRSNILLHSVYNMLIVITSAF